MRDFAVSLKLEPNLQGYLGLGRTLAAAGHRAEALTAYELALRISPDLAEARRAADALRR